MNISYAINEIRENWHDTDWVHQRIEHRIAGPVMSAIHGSDGLDYMSQDWDNLLILDATRADMFEELFDTSQFDSYRRVDSVGCSSPEWMRKTFDDRSFPDTVFVSANPWISKIAPNSFHHVENLWTTVNEVDEKELQDAVTLQDVDTNNDTIPASALTDVALDIAEEYPNKRLIVHYFQPHAPCIGLPDGSEKDEEDVNKDVHPGRTLKNGVVSRDEVWNQYLDNLSYAYYHAKRFNDNVNGKTVYTADHGEMFGEWCLPVPIRGYGHPSSLRHPKLTTVPWAVSDGERRKIVSGDINEHDADRSDIDDRLRNLGYRV